MKGKRSTEVKGYQNEPSWEDDLEIYQFPAGRLVTVRIFDPMFILARHWIPTQSKLLPGTKPNKKQQVKSFPKWCVSFDSDAETFLPDRYCPCHDDFGMKATTQIYTQAIIREMQERGDANPVRALCFPSSLVNKAFKDIAEINGSIPVEDDEKGVDVAIKYNPKANVFDIWSIQRVERTPLTDADVSVIDRYAVDLEQIAPDFFDEETYQSYMKSMRESLVRNKYYVKLDRPIRGNKNPWPFFAADTEGKPWHEFPELADYERQKESGGDDSNVPERDAVDMSRDEPRDEPREPRRRETRRPRPSSRDEGEEEGRDASFDDDGDRDDTTTKPPPRSTRKPRRRASTATATTEDEPPRRKKEGRERDDAVGKDDCTDFGVFQGALKCDDCPDREACVKGYLNR